MRRPFIVPVSPAAIGRPRYRLPPTAFTSESCHMLARLRYRERDARPLQCPPRRSLRPSTSRRHRPSRRATRLRTSRSRAAPPATTCAGSRSSARHTSASRSSRSVRARLGHAASRRADGTSSRQTCPSRPWRRCGGASRGFRTSRSSRRICAPGTRADLRLGVDGQCPRAHPRRRRRPRLASARSCEPGGSIVIYVPALNGLFGSWDDYAGTSGATRSGGCGRSCGRPALEPVELRYANFLAIPAWILSLALLEGRRGRAGTASDLGPDGRPAHRLVESRVRLAHRARTSSASGAPARG